MTAPSAESGPEPQGSRDVAAATPDDRAVTVVADDEEARPLPVVDASTPRQAAKRMAPPVIALLGNPNVGKTTLFNRLCGLRHHTSNFPGTTQDARVGEPRLAPGVASRLVDLPGVYGLELERSEARVARAALDGTGLPKEVVGGPPRLVLLVLDAANLERNLVLAAEVLARGHALVVALNMVDEARRRGRTVDAGRLAADLGAPVVPCSARRGEGVDALKATLAAHLRGEPVPGLAAPVPRPGTGAVSAPADRPPGAGDVGDPPPRVSERPARPGPGEVDPEAARRWAKAVARDAVRTLPATAGAADDGPTATDRLDAVLVHPIAGLACFAAVMTGLFMVVFKLATYPMDWLEQLFGGLGGAAAAALPDGLFEQMMVDGVVAGVGATVVFLPQICLLFLLLSLLEDTGYLARAALLADRWMRPFGLSGHAFVPLLSAHACALPAIAAARGVPDPRDRLATILAAPFMSCTARIPVYVLLTGILFPGRPTMQALAFTGCYLLGAGAGLLSAFVARRTVARGPLRPMTIELPTYRLPSLRTALVTAWDRGLRFLRKAGTVILAISIVLWWMGTFPQSGASPEGDRLRTEAAALEAAAPERSGALVAEADVADAQFGARRTFLGRLGGAVEPVVAPLGYDRTLAIGVLASFAAREVFVSTMAVQIAGSEEAAEEGLVETIASATRDDGETPIFTVPASWSLLVFYVLAMQCLPTVALTAREAGGWRWAFLQLGWMTALAWIGAFAAYRIALAAGA